MKLRTCCDRGTSHPQINNPFLPKALVLLLTVCATLPVTLSCSPSRNIQPPGTIPKGRPASIADEQYGHEVLGALQKNYSLDYNDPRYDQVVRVVERLTAAAGANQDPWHVYLFKAPEVKNAAATRGNHVFVWSGMLGVTQTDGELATVLAHEVAHVLAGHTEPDPNEEITKILLQVGAIAAGAAVSNAAGGVGMANSLGNLTASVTNEVGSGLLVYPYSREMEYEADQIGLFLMAKAGYDPADALKFWEKAARDPDMQQGMEFFSSHPDTSARVEKIKALLPRATNRNQNNDQWDSFAIGNNPSSENSAPSTDKQLPNKQPPPAPIMSAPRTWSTPTITAPRITANGMHLWTILERGVQVFSEPNSTSTLVGTLNDGQEVKVKRISGHWLEITSPVQGFIRKYQAQP